MINPFHNYHNLLPQSPEGDQYVQQEVILGGNWGARFSEHAADVRATTIELPGTEALDEERHMRQISETTRTKNEVLQSALGAGALEVVARDILAKRAAFTAQFGE